MPAQPLGWFKKEIKNPGDFKGLSYRTEGIAAALFQELGAAVTVLPSGEVVQVMDRGALDAAAMNNPSSDLTLGFPEVARFYMLGSYHRSAGVFELAFNKPKHDALPAEIKAILRHAALSASTSQLGAAYVRYPKDLDDIRKSGVNVVRTGDAVLQAELTAWDRVLADHSKEPFSPG